MATEKQIIENVEEGITTRKNPATGNLEMFDPGGFWREVSPEMAEWQKNTEGEPPIEPGIITSADARDSIKDFEKETASAPERTIWVSGREGTFNIALSALPRYREMGFEPATPGEKEKVEGLTAEERKAIGLEKEEDTPEITNLKSGISDLENKINAFINDISQIRQSNKDATNTLIENLRGQYVQRRQEILEIGEKTKSVLNTIGYRTGGLRYGGGVFEGLISEQERKTKQSIAQIDLMEQEAINNAKMALNDKDYMLFEKQLSIFEEQRKEKVNQLQELMKIAFQQNAEVKRKKEKIERQGTIASLIGQGITDKLKMFQLLGGTVDLKEIDETMDILIENSAELNEQVIDKFTDENGDRINIFYNKDTGELKQVKVGREKIATGGKITSTFRETAQGLEQIVLDENQNIIERRVLGISKESSGKIREAISNFKSADNMLNQIENLAQQVITAEEPEDIPKQYIQGRIEAITRHNPQATVFLSSIEAFSSMLTRAAGEKGVLTTQDVQRIINALPKLTDTRASAQLKMQTLRSLYNSIKSGAIEAYTSPLSELTGANKVLKEQVFEKGFDYDQMKADGLSDEEIKKVIGL